jgi:endonuclease/exonuclease/phosphatase family metal-dependent hydrolase
VRTLAAALLWLLAAPAAAEELTILSYNTHGLPSWIAGDDPEARFPRIGTLANAYDVVLLQEDFEHHEALRSTTHHGFIERGNPSRESLHCWITCSGSGLTFLASLPGERDPHVDNIPYGVCSGWFGNANDCFATKGFQHARVELDQAGTVHFVNTHLDAGDAAEDREARRQQLEILREYLAKHVAGEALILGGDLNLDEANPEDMELLETFTTALGLTNTGARAAADNSWTVLDYLYYRDGDETAVRILDAGEASEFQESGVPLSDHPALFVRIEAYRRLAIPPSTGMTAPVK